MTPLHLAVLVLCIATFIIFTIAGGVVFKANGRPPLELRLVLVIGLVSLAAVLGGVALWEAAGIRAWIGLAMLAAALALFLWAMWAIRGQRITRIYCQDTPEILVTSGPFRFIRHPSYAAYLLAYAASAVASGCPWLWLVFAAMVTLYVHAARFEEKKFAASALASEYTAYRRRTGMFWPGRGV